MEIVSFRLASIGKIRAIVDVCTSEGFIIRGFKVIESDNGFFVGITSERTKSGKYIDLVRIEDHSLREMLESVILDAFHEKVKNTS